VLEALKIDTDELMPYQDSKRVTSLLRNELKPGSIIRKETDAKVTTTLFLSNGAKVKYKKTDFKNDEIVMEAVSFGGTNTYSNDEVLKLNLLTRP
jgi:zinc protease